MLMTLQGKSKTSTTTQGVTAPSSASESLYQTRTSLFGQSHLPLWADGEPPADQGNTGGNQDGPSSRRATARQIDEDRLTTALERLLGQKQHAGDPNEVARTLLRENIAYRAQISELNEQRVPEGSRVVTNEQAARLAAYEALNPDPAALQTQLNAANEITQREQTRALAEVSKADSEVLADRLKAAGVTAEVREIAASGEQPARREVRVLDQSGKDLGDLRSYADQNWKPYLTALFPQGGESDAGQQQQVAGPIVAGQAGAGKPATGGLNPLIAARIKERAGDTDASGGTA